MLRLVIANLNYSSWSMRAWLALGLTGVEFRCFDVGMFKKEGWKDTVLSFSGAGKVPILIDGSLSVHESLAICETMAERFPDAGLWPNEAELRARARAVSAEMASGFLEIRNAMPCNLRGRSTKRPESEAMNVVQIWEASLSTSPGDFLFGNFGIADCMYMPLVSRFRTYGVELPDFATRYQRAVLSHPLVTRLEEIAAKTEAISRYDEFL
jgi:glutathione S-transferase